MDRGAWQATVYGTAQSDLTELLSTVKLRLLLCARYCLGKYEKMG